MAATAGIDARNATFKTRIGTTQHHLMYGQKKDVSGFRAFGCRAWVYIDPQRPAKGKHTPRAEEAIYVGFAFDTSALSFYVVERNKIVTTNQVKFSEHEFPVRKRRMVEKHSIDNSTDMLFQSPSDVQWVPYNMFHVGNYDKVHYDNISYVLVLRVVSKINTFARTSMSRWQHDQLSLHKSQHREQANFAGVKHRTLKGLDPRINPDKPPRNFRDATKALDKQAWAEAYNSECLEFVEQDVFKVVKLEQGVRIHDTITRLEYKEDNGDFLKVKARMCVRGDQQIAGVSFKETDLYAPVLKAAEARVLLALAAANGDKILKTDTKRAYLYGDMGDDVVYIRPPDWWPQPIPKGHVLLLLQSIYGARTWHERISSWMERNGYAAVNSEKTIFMKLSGFEYIIHGLFVDDMMHIYSCDAIKDEFMHLYSRDFEITGGRQMKTFLGMQVEQTTRSIKIHLDHYIKEVVAVYAEHIRKAIRPKKVPIAPSVVLRPEDTPELPDPRKQKFHRSFVAKLQFAATWVRFDIAITVSQPTRFCASAGSSHWAAIHHLMEYLAGTPGFKITYRRSKGRSNLLSGYADVDCGTSCSRRSTSGTLMLYNKAPIMWRSKMQKATALSTAEAEYYSASTAGTEILYLRAVMEQLGIA